MIVLRSERSGRPQRLAVLAGDRISKKYRRAHERKLRLIEYRRLRDVIPALDQQQDVTKVTHRSVHLFLWLLVRRIQVLRHWGLGQTLFQFMTALRLWTTVNNWLCFVCKQIDVVQAAVNYIDELHMALAERFNLFPGMGFSTIYYIGLIILISTVYQFHSKAATFQ